MTDYVIIDPDGTSTEGEGYPHALVGCHGVGGQMLWGTRKYVDGVQFVYRLIMCDCALIMPEEHAENPVANAVLLALGYHHKVRGKIAITHIGPENEQMPFTPKQLERLQGLAVIGRSLTEQRVPVEAVRVDGDGGVQVSLTTLLEKAHEHFDGCHPEDEQAPGNPEGYQPQETEPCWHCGTPTTRGACHCSHCQDEDDDDIPQSAIYHCQVCRRWWAHMYLNVTKITFGESE